MVAEGFIQKFSTGSIYQSETLRILVNLYHRQSAGEADNILPVKMRIVAFNPLPFRTGPILK